MAACIVVGFVVARFTSSNTRQFTLVLRDGKATLAVSGLKAAPSGKTYEAWVIWKNAAPRPAGLFRGGSTSVRLRGVVPQHAVVAVTVERAGGAKAPTTSPIFSTRT